MSEKLESRIKELEERLAQTIPNKHTQKSINYLRAQLAKLRNEMLRVATSKKGGGVGFGVKKSGDAQVAFIGYPSVGKSSILNLLTGGNTNSKVASYDFTTLTAIPGMMEIARAKIQLIDLPGIILGAASGKGRGKEIIGASRTADLILIIICFKEDGTLDLSDLHSIRQELFNASIRLNQDPPRITIKEQTRGGIGFTYNGDQIMDADEVKGVMNELGYHNASVYFSEPNIDAEQLIDHIMGNRVYIKEFVVINKMDLMKKSLSHEEITEKIGHDHWLLISAKYDDRIEDLKMQIFKELELIRVYLKPPGKEVDMEDPIVLPREANLETLCKSLHKSFIKNFRYALIWGPSAKHEGQKFSSFEHMLEDGDIVSIYLKR